MRIAGSCALVVGGAFGLGAACAHALAREGAHVVIADTNQADGQRLAREIGGQFVATDVRVPAQVGAAAAAAPGPLRISVQCAAVGWRPDPAPTDATTARQSLERMLSLHLIATFNALRAASTAMLEAEGPLRGERGVCVNTASVLHAEGHLRDVAYAAARGIMAGMSLPSARDLRPLGIRVATLAPQISDCSAPSNTDPDDYAALVCHVIKDSSMRGDLQTRDARPLTPRL